MEIWRRAISQSEAGEALALVTVIRVSGSAPRHVGAHMLVGPDGRGFATIGGGRVELEITAEAARVAAGEPARRVVHHLVRDLAMCCGGSMEFYIEPVAPSLPALRQVVAVWHAREPMLLVTPLDGRPKSARALAADGMRRPMIEDDHLLEPVWPRERVILFGAGHVGRATGPMAALVGFDVVVCDDGDTGALAAVTGAPWLCATVESFDTRDVEAEIGPLGHSDYVLIMTRDHAVDQAIVEQLLGNESLAYLGLIGSRGKVGRFHKRLLARGIATEEQWARLHAPIGLDIGAETPEEIAVAVVAELVQVRRKRRG